MTDGLLDTVTIEADGDTDLGDTKGSITTTFSEYGVPQSIVAPPSNQISDEFPGGSPTEMPEGFEEALDTRDELASRRPDLCVDVFGDPDADIPLDDLIVQTESFAVCLEESGEQAAADAFRTLNDVGD